MISREMISNICDKPQDQRDMVNELVEYITSLLKEQSVVFGTSTDQIRKDNNDKIDKLKCQHAEELKRLKEEDLNYKKAYLDTLDTLKYEINRHKFYKEAVKDILGNS